jgi:hypothetical protein
MPSLTPQQLHEARIRSGRLGGRPRKPTPSEARERALEELTPKALEVLRRELDEGGPQAVRAAMKILDHAWGTPAHRVEVSTPELESHNLDLRSMTAAELTALRLRLEQRQVPAVADDP